ncbi:MAG: tRNA (adenosine(37)-N6)-threonylcarbamoyltransferase complex transferase subunit TsaD [Verrucomicrobiota bacterium]
MHILGIETSCDETGVAVVDLSERGLLVLEDVVSSQIALHEPYGGVVPEIAVREHLRNLPRLVPKVLEQARIGASDLDVIAVTEGPGLASSLLVGNAYARALAVASDVPAYGINHLEGHLFSPFLADGTELHFPFVGLIVSGGHTLLVQALEFDRYIRLGATIDDAAGEAFDKVARLFGLPYPGGPALERLAESGNPEAYDFPRSLPGKDDLNFSFSGLKTAVRYFYEKHPHSHGDEQWLADLCASFQQAVIDVLVRKSLAAVERTRGQSLVAAGGVVCNRALRLALQRACREKGVRLLVATPGVCTDNAAMIAATAAFKIHYGCEPEIGGDINPTLSLFSPEPEGDFNKGLLLAKKLRGREPGQLAQ